MAGEWIKLENVTPDKPEVYTIAETLGIDPDAVLGKLCRIWIWADEQTVDGNAKGNARGNATGNALSVTRALVDRISGVTGFTDAMLKSGWLQQTENGFEFPNFYYHNGLTAKQRALTAKRQRRFKAKSNATGNATGNGASVTSALSKEEKRREENKDSKTEECNEPTKSASLPPVPLQPASPTVLTFPCSGKGAKEWALTKQQIDDWAVSFPAVDVLAECRAAWAWIDANPTRKKTATGMKSFLVRWMGKAQNNGPAKTAPQQFKSSAEREREYSAKMAQNIFDRIPPEKLAEIAREEAEEKARQEARKLPTYRQTPQALSAAKPRKDPPPGFQYPGNWDTMQNYEQDMWLIDNGFSPVQRVKEYA